jgi:DNA polymerase I-like protein with 3'-5' exonuclease and polymerase domains
MKRAKIIAYKELTKQGIWFRYVNDIHDEFQTITEKKHATIVGQTKVNAIRFVGKLYNSLCPLDGDYRIGLSWKDCH